jgi:hypothetical protein
MPISTIRGELGRIADEVAHLRADKSSTAVTADDINNACEFFACCVHPHDLSLNETHRLAEPFCRIGCSDLHAIVAMGKGPTDACKNIQAEWKASPPATKHEVSPKCLDIICRGGTHIVSMAKKDKT